MRKMTITIRDGHGKRENNNKDESSKKKDESDEIKQIERRILCNVTGYHQKDMETIADT